MTKYPDMDHRFIKFLKLAEKLLIMIDSKMDRKYMCQIGKNVLFQIKKKMIFSNISFNEHEQKPQTDSNS